MLRNPNIGEFTIQLSGINEEEITLIQIKNMLGEDAYSVELNFDEINHSVNLRSQLVEGMYLVEIHTSEGVVTKQIIIHD